jgi:hypothetical protein
MERSKQPRYDRLYSVVTREGEVEPLDQLMFDEFDSGYSQLRDLYWTARRSALNVDQVIADVETAIDKL